MRKRTRRAEVIQLGAGGELGNEPGLLVAETNMDDSILETPATSEQPDQAAARAQARRLLEAKIDELPDAFRTVFVLRAVEEMSVEEAAVCLGIPEATVRTRFFRARSLLREALAREFDVAFAGAFSFAGERCDRIVAGVMARLKDSQTRRV